MLLESRGRCWESFAHCMYHVDHYCYSLFCKSDNLFSRLALSRLGSLRRLHLLHSTTTPADRKKARLPTENSAMEPHSTQYYSKLQSVCALRTLTISVMSRRATRRRRAVLSVQHFALFHVFIFACIPLLTTDHSHTTVRLVL